MGPRFAARRAGSHEARAEMARKTMVTAAKVAGSVDLTPTSMAAMTRPRRKAATIAQRNADGAKAQALQDDELDDIAAFGSQGHAHADLGGSLANDG